EQIRDTIVLCVADHLAYRGLPGGFAFVLAGSGTIASGPTDYPRIIGIGRHRFSRPRWITVRGDHRRIDLDRLSACIDCLCMVVNCDLLREDRSCRISRPIAAGEEQHTYTHCVGVTCRTGADFHRDQLTFHRRPCEFPSSRGGFGNARALDISNEQLALSSGCLTPLNAQQLFSSSITCRNRSMHRSGVAVTVRGFTCKEKRVVYRPG